MSESDVFKIAMRDENPFDFMWQAPQEKKCKTKRAGFKGAKKHRAKRKIRNKMAKQSRRANSR